MEISEGKSFRCFDVRKVTACDLSVFNLNWFFPYQSVTSVKHCSIFVIASEIGWCVVNITMVLHAMSCNDVTDGSGVYAVYNWSKYFPLRHIS